MFQFGNFLSPILKFIDSFLISVESDKPIGYIIHFCYGVLISHISFFLKLIWLYFFFFFKFIYLWLCWVFVSVRGLSLVAASGDHSSLRCAGLSPSWPLLLRSTGSRRAGSAIVAHGPSCSAARGILPDQGSNPCPPHWQADSQPLRHQGSPLTFLFESFVWVPPLC